MKPARTVALEVIHEVDRDGAYSNIALNRALEKHNPEKKDRGFITELVYGTLKRLNTIDWIAGQFVNRSLDSLAPIIKNIIRMGIYQLFYMDKVPESAAVNESTKLARKFGHPGTVKFVNGVMRNITRKKGDIEWPDRDKSPVEHLTLTYSHPQWMVERWIQDLGFEQAEGLCRANNDIPANSIRTNTLRISREKLIEQLEEEGIQCREGEFAPETIHISGFHSIGNIDAHSKGLFLVQDESSTMVGHALSPQPGSRVIDACSAPGGKSTHLAQLMENKGQIISSDVHEHKITLVEDNVRRLGMNIIEPVLLDATKLSQNYPGWADFILVDAPCSGLGVLRRRPEVRWRKTVEQFAELTKLQLAILESAGGALKDGGTLVYSTCTVNREENLGLVESFLAANPAFTMVDLTTYLPANLEQSKFPTAKEGYLQFFPHQHGTDGFFMARLAKKG